MAEEKVERVELTRPMSVGGKSRKAGDIVPVSEFDSPQTVEVLKQSKAVKPASAGKAEG